MSSSPSAPSLSRRLLAIAASRPGALTLVVIAVICFQVGASIAKSLFAPVGAQGASALRLFFAALMLWICFRPWRTPVAAGARWTVLVYGLSLGAMNLMFYLSLRSVPLGLAVALEFTGPITVSLLFSRRRLDFLWVGCAVAGLLLLVRPGQSAGIDPLGAAYALGAGACWGLYIVVARKAGNLHGMGTTAWGMLIGAMVVVPAGIWQAGSRLLDPALLPAALSVALLSSALPYSIEMFALQSIPMRSFGILMSLDPAVAALAGFLLLGEQLDARQWLAVAAVISASIGTTLSGSTDAGNQDALPP